MVDRSQTSVGTSSAIAGRRRVRRPLHRSASTISATCFALRGGMGVYALSHHLGYGSVSVTEIYLRSLDGDAAQIARAA
jgi:hypothetical protein